LADRHETLRDGTRVLIRALRPEDAALYPDFLADIDTDDLRLRAFAVISEVTPRQIERLTHFDRAHAFALAAIAEDDGRLLGVARVHNEPGDQSGEFAVLVRSPLKGHGLGWLLMQRMIEVARERGLQRVYGEVLRENTTMLTMCRELGFETTADRADPAVEVATLTLDAPQPEPR
jgi:acetyltransferase